MARGVQKDDFGYDVESQSVVGEVEFTCLISMDKFNVSPSETQKIRPSTGTAVQFHIPVSQNKGMIGIHPRKFRLEYKPTLEEVASCTVANPARYVEIPVLTIAQYNDTPLFNEALPSADQEASKIRINHSADGNSSLVYNVVEKIPERLV
jgi:hypothetical protein